MKRQRTSAGRPSLTSGFTIVELLVTIFVCGILITGFSVALVSQTAVSAKARDAVIANAFAEGKFESIRSKGFLGLTDGTTSITGELPSELKAPRTGTLVVSSYSSSVKLVELTITFSERGLDRTYQYSTYVGELGVGQY